MKTKVEKVKVRRVLSSDGSRTYTVTLYSDHSCWCTCKGFLRHRSCKHVAAVRTNDRRFA